MQRTGRARVLFVTDFYIEEVLEGIVDFARDAGWELNASMRFHGLFPAVTEADGILATVVRDAGVRQWLARRKDCPVVRMLATGFDLEFPAVEADYVAAGRAGARHLLELGHVNFAFYFLYGMTDTDEVRAAFESELAAAGRPVHRLDFAAAHPGRSPSMVPHEERCRWLMSALERLPMPLAIMSDDDRRCLELMEACDLAGRRVPDDVAILGCDNHPVEQRLARVPLSSVDMNFKRLGREAAALLDRVMRGETPPAQPVKVPAQGVVARCSTATFITDSPGLTSAVLYMRERFREPLRLGELARRAGLTKRRFEAEFKRRLGRTPREELQRVRLACAARLLRDTDFKLEAIAVESGFGSACALCRVFTEAYGVSPTGWRKQTHRS